jgi:flagellar capping protein FliD
MDLFSILKIFSDRPEIAVIVLLLMLVGFGIQRLFNTGFKLLADHLQNIDGNFKSVAKDLGGLRVDVAKVAERLEAREEVVDTKINELDRRVTRLEDRGERVQ